MKKLRGFLVVLLTLTMALLGTVPALASSDEVSGEAPSEFLTNTLRAKRAPLTRSEETDAKAQGLEIVTKITDQKVLRELVNKGEISTENGEVPECFIVYKTIETEDPIADQFEEQFTDNLPRALAAKPAITVTKSDYYDGKYFNDYDRYVLPGYAYVKKTWSRTSYNNWDVASTGNVSAGGNVYGIVEIKGAVSSSMGRQIGTTKTYSEEVFVSVPEGKKAEYKIWTSFRVFTFTAKAGSYTLKSGKCWYPNGLIITKAVTNN